jgi:hypothetical protein
MGSRSSQHGRKEMIPRYKEDIPDHAGTPEVPRKSCPDLLGWTDCVPAHKTESLDARGSPPGMTNGCAIVHLNCAIWVITRMPRGKVDQGLFCNS